MPTDTQSSNVHANVQTTPDVLREEAQLLELVASKIKEICPTLFEGEKEEEAFWYYPNDVDENSNPIDYNNPMIRGEAEELMTIAQQEGSEAQLEKALKAHAGRIKINQDAVSTEESERLTPDEMDRAKYRVIYEKIQNCAAAKRLEIGDLLQKNESEQSQSSEISPRIIILPAHLLEGFNRELEGIEQETRWFYDSFFQRKSFQLMRRIEETVSYEDIMKVINGNCDSEEDTDSQDRSLEERQIQAFNELVERVKEYKFIRPYKERSERALDFTIRVLLGELRMKSDTIN